VIPQFNVQDALDTVLSKLQEGSSAYFGASAVHLRGLHRFDREVSVVLQVRVDGAADAHEIFVKVFKPRGLAGEQRDLMRTRVLHDFATSLRVHNQMAGLDGFSAVRPIACFPDELAIVTERAAGDTLGVVLERKASWWPTAAQLAELESTLSRAGAWIRAFQAGTPEKSAFSLAGMRAYLDIRLRRLISMPRARFPEAWRAGVLRYFDARSAEIGSADLHEAPIHADIAPGNVLVNGDDIIVIDFAMATTGGKYHDVSRLYSQLEFLNCKPKFRASVVAKLQSALLEGFEPGLSPRHPLFELFLVQHVVCHLANLSGHPGSGLSRPYNWYQRQEHRRWLVARCALPSA
jgi:hypothetical protein